MMVMCWTILPVTLTAIDLFSWVYFILYPTELLELWHYHQLHDLLMGLDFLHQHNFVHGDIRAVSYLEFLSCARPLTAHRTTFS